MLDSLHSQALSQIIWIKCLAALASLIRPLAYHFAGDSACEIRDMKDLGSKSQEEVQVKYTKFTCGKRKYLLYCCEQWVLESDYPWRTVNNSKWYSRDGRAFLFHLPADNKSSLRVIPLCTALTCSREKVRSQREGNLVKL